MPTKNCAAAALYLAWSGADVGTVHWLPPIVATGLCLLLLAINLAIGAAAYTLLLQNPVLLVLYGIGFGLVHGMVRKEEAHLESVHGETYRDYKERVPRYLLL